MEEVYKDMVSQEDLAKLDSQPNPFNFSERVSQTNRFSRRVSIISFLTTLFLGY